jgi:hypothetical protein
MWEAIFDTVFDSPIQSFIDYITNPFEVVQLPYKVFNFFTDMFFGLLSYSKPMFAEFGNRAIATFDFDFKNNFVVTVIGLMFGFFLFKFILSKVFDLLGRWVDPM